MIKNADMKTVPFAKQLAERLCAKYDSCAAETDDKKVWVQTKPTMMAHELVEMVPDDKLAFVSLAHPFVVVIFAEDREAAHQKVLNELQSRRTEQWEINGSLGKLH